MKTAILFAATAMLASTAFAVGKPKTAKATTHLPCAVMTTNKVAIKDATSKKMFADHKGRRYFFCCAGCPEAFQKDPAKYAKAANSIPTPKK